MIDVVVIRDPDFSNAISVFGDDEAVIVDLDLGKLDLSDPEEWAGWVEYAREDYERVQWNDARKTIAHAVYAAAEKFDHPVPAWLGPPLGLQS